MALVIRGTSRCRLCGLVIAEGETIVTFPPGLFRPHEEAFEVNDAGVHRACLLKANFADVAFRRLEEFLDPRMTALERLLTLIAPPTRVVAPGYDWDAVQASLGPLPTDYVALADTYGPCTFDNFLTVFAPQAENEYLDLTVQAERQLWALRQTSDAWGSGHVPFDLGQGVGGELLPWGVTVNGDLCFWVRRSPDPDSWTVAVYESRGPDWFESTGNITEFLVGVLSGERMCGIFVEDFPSQPHSCIGH